MYKVYKHENKINGKVYIGITSMNVNKRWENGNGYSKQPLFWRAIQKYGWHSFSHEILYDGLSKELAEQKEIELIAAYNSNCPQYGYNIQNGGNSLGKHSEETRKKMSKTHKGKVISIEQRQRISNTLKGRKMPPETRQKISEATKGENGYWYGKPGPTRRMVRCIETGTIYNSITEAGEKNNINHRNIQRVCSGKRKATGGFHWEYVG